MTKDVGVEIPARLRQVQRKLERWRSGHHGRSPLPEALWRVAGEAVRFESRFVTKTLASVQGPAENFELGCRLPNRIGY